MLILVVPRILILTMMKQGRERRIAALRGINTNWRAMEIEASVKRMAAWTLWLH